MGVLINGKTHATAIHEEIKTRLARIEGKPHLAVVLVGENPASKVYVEKKQKACEEVGIDFSLHTLSEDATQREVLTTIDRLNSSSQVTGILVQQPLPAHIDKHSCVSKIHPSKDVDCLHPYNIGLAMTGQGNVLPGTPAGIISLLDREQITLEGKHIVIVGRSEIVGKPLAFMLLQRNATVTICHSHTQNLAEICSTADILIVAIGKAKFITAEYIKDGAIVIDVGVNHLDAGNSEKSGKLVGDVDFENVLDKVSYITPVPGGVGPMTVATLLENCLRAWELCYD